MLNLELFFDELAKQGVRFYTGVPDSYLNGFCSYADQHFPSRYIIAANEGNAVGIAAGHYIATKEIPLVFMQNSGIGNAVNPLVSLADENVYSIPIILLIGWRGEPGTGDHPQHILQGAVTTDLMDVIRIPYVILKDDDDAAAAAIEQAVMTARSSRKAFALIVPKGLLSGTKENIVDDSYPMSREEAIEITLDQLPEDTIYAATTGRATRELFFLREQRGETKSRDFLNVGSMGHASSVALGIALEHPERKVVVFDGDGAAIMHMGALTMAGKLSVPNLIHIVLNNGAHESVGGQPSAGHRIDFTAVAKACGYRTPEGPVTNKEELIEALRAPADPDRASFLDVRIHKGLSRNLPEIRFNHLDAVNALIDELTIAEA